MTDDQTRSARKFPDHSPHARDERDIIFITVCTQMRISLLATESSHLILRNLWADSSQWRVGRYVVMPEHIHLFAVRACTGTISLKRWIGWWKRGFSVALNFSPRTWQRDFWDTRIRSPEHYAEKWNYVRDNPVRRGLVIHPEDWEFQGEIYRLKM